MENVFKGIWPAMFTPVGDNGAPSYDQLQKLVELLISQGLNGLYILGSTGQGVLFTEEQRKKVTEEVVATASGRIPIMVQVGSLTTAESVRLANHAELAGVHAISSVGPIYYSGNTAMALEHYSSIAGATSLPFFPYQLGDNSMAGDPLGFVKKLLDIPNVKGMKLTTSQLLEISTIHNYAGDKLKLFSGSDELFCHASLCGAVGAIGSFYNIWGVQCKNVLNEFVIGNYRFSKEFMLSFQDMIRYIIPNAWSFFRHVMLLKYNIDLGQSKAPLGNVQTQWNDEDVLVIMERIESLANSEINL